MQLILMRSGIGEKRLLRSTWSLVDGLSGKSNTDGFLAWRLWVFVLVIDCFCWLKLRRRLSCSPADA